MFQENKKGILTARISLLGILEMHSISYRHSTSKGTTCSDLSASPIVRTGLQVPEKQVLLQNTAEVSKAFGVLGCSISIKILTCAGSRAPLSQHWYKSKFTLSRVLMILQAWIEHF